MAELQESHNTSENSARFIEFVMMQAQNASLFLGLIPNPHSGQPEVNLDLARMFIDQLVMIQGKTRGNLTTEETGVLRNALSNLQMAFFEVSQGQGKSGSARPAGGGAATPPLEEDPVREDGRVPAAVAETPGAPAAQPAPAVEPQESKKRFSKSYGS
jgi:hypothetical protein